MRSVVLYYFINIVIYFWGSLGDLNSPIIHGIGSGNRVGAVFLTPRGGQRGSYLLHPQFFILICNILSFTSFQFHPRDFISIYSTHPFHSWDFILYFSYHTFHFLDFTSIYSYYDISSFLYNLLSFYTVKFILNNFILKYSYFSFQSFYFILTISSPQIHPYYFILLIYICQISSSYISDWQIDPCQFHPIISQCRMKLNRMKKLRMKNVRMKW